MALFLIDIWKYDEALEYYDLAIKDDRIKLDGYKLAMFTFEYKSIINNSIQTIKIDISLKNKLQLKPIHWKIQSIYIDNVLEESIFKEHFVNCIDIKESTAEKLRAALTRKNPAIRDFFDIWYIKNNSDFDFNEIYKFILTFKIKNEIKNIYNYWYTS